MQLSFPFRIGMKACNLPKKDWKQSLLSSNCLEHSILINVNRGVMDQQHGYMSGFTGVRHKRDTLVTR